MRSIFKRPDSERRQASSSAVVPQEPQTVPLNTSEAGFSPNDVSRLGLIEFCVPGAADPAIDATTWKHQHTGFWWPEQLGRDIPDARILLFNYDTFFHRASRGSNCVRIKGLAENLRHQLLDNRPEENVESRPIVMIGHSLGGLIIKEALIQCNDHALYKSILQSTISIMFFGTPNAGSLATGKKRVDIFKLIGRSVGYEVPKKIAEALRSHSDELLDISNRFQTLSIWDTTPPSVMTFYETLANPVLNILIVDAVSATLGVRGEDRYALQADHNQMVKFRDGKDAIYKSVIATFKRARERAINLTLGATPGLTRNESSSRSINLPFGFPLETSPPENVLLANSEEQPTHSMDGGTGGTGFPAASKAQESQISHIDRPIRRQEKNFMGHRDHLDNMDEQFLDVFREGCKKPHIIGLLGIGGGGKTQLALKYFREATTRQHNPFRTAFWIDASSETALQTAISGISKIIQPQRRQQAGLEAKHSQDTVLSQVMDTFESWTRPYLLIFDDVSSNRVLDYIPRTGPAAVILTTRLMEADRDLDTSIWIRGLPLDTATSLLLRLLSLDGASSSKHEENTEAAKAIAQRLGGLPLAIHAAASYIRSQHLTNHLSQFLPRYEEQKLRMLHKPYNSWGDDERSQSVFTTWELSLRILGTDEEDRARKSHFLSVCSFLSPHRISHVHFEQHYRRRSLENYVWCSTHHDWMKIFLNSKDEFDRTLFLNVITQFEALSLVESCSVDEFGSVSFSLHPLVRDWAMVRQGCCDGQTHLAEALTCLAATLNACNFIDGHVQPAYLIYEVVTRPMESATPQIKEAWLLMDSELHAHVDSCLVNFAEYQWELKHQEALGLKRPEDQFWFLFLANSITIYEFEHQYRLHELFKLNEHVFPELSLDERIWELDRLLRETPDGLLYTIKPQVEKARSLWQRDQSGTNIPFRGISLTILLLSWFLRTEDFDSFEDALPVLIEQAEYLVDKSLDKSSDKGKIGSVWRKWIRYWRPQPLSLESYKPIIAQRVLLWIVFFIEDLGAQYADPERLLPIMQWLNDSWLPKCYQAYMNTSGDNKDERPLILYGLAHLRRIQWDLGRVDDLTETIKAFDSVTTKHEWLFTLSRSAGNFLWFKAMVHRAKGEWNDAAAKTADYINWMRIAWPDDTLLQGEQFSLAECYLRATPPNKTRADEIISSIIAEVKATNGPLSQNEVYIRWRIFDVYYKLRLYDEAYKVTTRLLRDVLARDTFNNETVLDIEDCTGSALVSMLATNHGLHDKLQKKLLTFLEQIMASLFVRWKDYTPNISLISYVIKFYLSRELWGQARWIFTECALLIGRQQCGHEEFRGKESRLEFQHLMHELIFVRRAMDLFPAKEYRMLFDSLEKIFKEIFTSEDFATCRLAAAEFYIQECKYRLAEIHYDWAHTWFATHDSPDTRHVYRGGCYFHILTKFMLKKWRDAYATFLELSDMILIEDGDGSLMANLHALNGEKTEAKYWVEQSLPGLWGLQTLGDERIVDDHISVWVLREYAFRCILLVKCLCDKENKEKIAQNGDAIPSSRNAETRNQHKGEGLHIVWEHVRYPLGLFLGNLNPGRLELLGFALITSGMLGWNAFRLFRSRKHYSSTMFRQE
ncbi:hypothetical protein F5Y13DRAFT_201125 [Hypoxylon sp. FL1857]|nr:hypothetical protein F5Y13DRAFT_201125 [Hypoxylon sp. FL1857]